MASIITTTVSSGTKTVSSFRTGAIEDNLFHLGMLLGEGLNLPEALRQLAMSTGNGRLKTAASKAAGQLVAGLGCEEVFTSSETGVFTRFARYILASPLSDKTKGRLLSHWQRRQTSIYQMIKGLSLVAQTMVIGLFTCMTLIGFVLPQFREIMFSLNRHANDGQPTMHSWLLEFFGTGGSGSILMIGLLFIVGLALAIAFFQRIFKTSEILDEVNLFKMLVIIEPSQRAMVLELLATPIYFPRMHHKLKRFAIDLNGGNDVTTACQNAGLGQFVSWFMHLAMNPDTDDQALLQGVTLLETTYDTSFQRVVSTAEVISILGQGVLFGTFAYIVFQTMVEIMLGAMK